MDGYLKKREDRSICLLSFWASSGYPQCPLFWVSSFATQLSSASSRSGYRDLGLQQQCHVVANKHVKLSDSISAETFRVALFLYIHLPHRLLMLRQEED